MSDLFDTSAFKQDSPRLAWVKKHNVRVLHTPEMDNNPWCAWIGAEDLTEFLSRNGYHMVGVGFNQFEALADLAQKHGLRLWNEEGA